MAHELNRNGQYYCSRLGTACDFQILNLPSDELVAWILAQNLPLDSLYLYGIEPPISTSAMGLSTSTTFRRLHRRGHPHETELNNGNPIDNPIQPL